MIVPPRFHFISGLPRSGSTLLSALLRQNPRFSAAVTSPVAALVGAAMSKMGGGGEFAAFFDDARRTTILRGLFISYYANRCEGEVVFDTNRTWTGKLPMILELFPDAKVICCIREIGWIVDSIEWMLGRNPLQYARIFDFKPGLSLYARVETLMNSDSGLVGLAWANLREAWFGPYADRLILVGYDNLTRQPSTVLKRIYQEIGEPW